MLAVILKDERIPKTSYMPPHDKGYLADA